MSRIDSASTALSPMRPSRETREGEGADRRTSPRRASLVNNRLATNSISLTLLIVFIAGWQLVLTGFSVSSLLVPKPSEIYSRVIDGFKPGPASYYGDLRTTLIEVFLGFVIAVFVGGLVGMFLAQWPLLEKISYPYMFAFQVVPKIAIAPLIVLWAGFGAKAMVTVTVVTAFWSMMVSSLAGFKSVPLDETNMFAGLCATRTQTFFKLKIPAAMPMILSGIDLALSYALHGAILAEFVGGQMGLGVRIETYNTNVDVSGEFAVIIVLAVLGIIFQTLVNMARKKLLFWTASEIARTAN